MEDFIYTRNYRIYPSSYFTEIKLEVGGKYTVAPWDFTDIVTNLLKDGYILTIGYNDIDKMYSVYIKDKQCIIT